MAIAQACGWTIAGNGESICKAWINPNGNRVSSWHNKIEEATYCLPDYLNDLNAMNAAENTFTLDQRKAYFDLLVKAVAGSANNPCHSDYPKVVSAIAEQRAEAFLKTLGMWKADHSGERTDMVKAKEKA